MIEQLIAFFSPHHCKICTVEGTLLCEGCLPNVFMDMEDCCYRCNIPLSNATICTKCQSHTALSNVWIAGNHDTVLAQLVHDFKFERAKAAVKPLAQGIADSLPYLPGHIIVPIPTAPKRVRIRGYDQAYLLAHELGEIIGLRHTSVLARNHNLRQVGADRKTRFEQAKGAFRLRSADKIKNEHILLVDDVLTTGATLEAAAAILKKAGAASVQAVVAARQL